NVLVLLFYTAGGLSDNETDCCSYLEWASGGPGCPPCPILLVFPAGHHGQTGWSCWTVFKGGALAERRARFVRTFNRKTWPWPMRYHSVVTACPSGPPYAWLGYHWPFGRPDCKISSTWCSSTCTLQYLGHRRLAAWPTAKLRSWGSAAAAGEPPWVGWGSPPPPGLRGPFGRDATCYCLHRRTVCTHFRRERAEGPASASGYLTSSRCWWPPFGWLPGCPSTWSQDPLRADGPGGCCPGSCALHTFLNNLHPYCTGMPTSTAALNPFLYAFFDPALPPRLRRPLSAAGPPLRPRALRQLLLGAQPPPRRQGGPRSGGQAWTPPPQETLFFRA
uniref:Uncharacterized protein n=1 Tax=Malurus cyaneus samueli TaxID=2593467 RepID=A0A8C5UHK9_9PASS